MSDLLYFSLVVGVLAGVQGGISTWKRPRSHTRRQMDYDEGITASVLWEAFCVGVTEKVPWLPVAGNILFWLFFVGASFWVYSHWDDIVQ